MIFALILTPLFIFLSLGDTSQFTEVLHQAEIAASKDFTDLFSSTTPVSYTHLLKILSIQLIFYLFY